VRSPSVSAGVSPSLRKPGKKILRSIPAIFFKKYKIHAAHFTVRYFGPVIFPVDDCPFLLVLIFFFIEVHFFISTERKKDSSGGIKKHFVLPASRPPIPPHSINVLRINRLLVHVSRKRKNRTVTTRPLLLYFFLRFSAKKKKFSHFFPPHVTWRLSCTFAEQKEKMEFCISAL
jgi:hypothetical protein